MTFAPHMSTIFRTLGVSAVYAPPSGPEVPCKAMRATQPLRFGGIELSVEGLCLDLLRSEVSPELGGSIALDGVSYSVDVPPIPFPVDQDPQGLRWRLLLGWGSEVTYRSGEPAEAPVQGGPWSVSVAAPAGAAAVSIKSRYINVSGRLRTGDVLTIGDSAYTVTAPISATGSQTFANVPIAPALAAPVAVGDAVTIETPSASGYDIRAALADYEAQQVMGAVQAGDRRLIVPAVSFSAAGLADEPEAGAVVQMDDGTLSVITARGHYQAGAPVVWELQVRS